MAEFNAGFLPWSQSKEIKILLNSNSFSRIGIEPTTIESQSHSYAPTPRRPRKMISVHGESSRRVGVAGAE